MANPLAEAARRGLEIGRLQGKEEQVAKFDKLEETRKLVNKWRQDNNLPSTVTPSKKDFPAWTHPFLQRVQAEPLTIAHGTHRPDTGWAQFGHPGPEDKGSPHKQYNPSGEPLFNPIDGGDIVPWDLRPTNDLQISDARGDAILQGLPRTKSGSHREALKSGELTPDQLIEALKIASPLLRLREA